VNARSASRGLPALKSSFPSDTCETRASFVLGKRAWSSPYSDRAVAKSPTRRAALASRNKDDAVLSLRCVLPPALGGDGGLAVETSLASGLTGELVRSLSRDAETPPARGAERGGIVTLGDAR